MSVESNTSVSGSIPVFELTLADWELLVMDRNQMLLDIWRGKEPPYELSSKLTNMFTDMSELILAKASDDEQIAHLRKMFEFMSKFIPDSYIN